MLRITPHPAFVAHVKARRGALDFAPRLPEFSELKVWTMLQNTMLGGRNHWVGRMGDNVDVKRTLAIIQQRALPEPYDMRLVALAERIIPFNARAEGGTFVRRVAERLGLLPIGAM